MKPAFLAVALAIARPAMAQEAPVLEANRAGSVRELDLRFDADTSRGSSPVVWQRQVAVAGTNYIRLRLRRDGAPFPDEAMLHIFPEKADRFSFLIKDIPEEGRWTPLLHGSSATIAIESRVSPPSDAVFVIDNLSSQSAEPVLYSTHGILQLQNILATDVPDHIKALSGPVALLSFFDSQIPRTCSGFLIEEDLLVTNEHCINSDENCSTMAALFGYRRNGSGTEFGPQVHCAGWTPMQSSFDLDLTAIRLTEPPGSEFGVVTLPDAPPPPDGALAIVQHAGDFPQQVSLLDCAVSAAPVSGRVWDTDFTHTCDTAKGSSGSPIFNEDGILVGVHHFGFKDAQGSAWTENRGVLSDFTIQWLVGQRQTIP